MSALDKKALHHDTATDMSVRLQYLTDSEGEKTAVLLPLEEYERLMEDLSDLAAIADRRDEETVSHEKFLANLKSNGVL